MTHTYAILEISGPAYAEIRKKLLAAGYDHVFHKDDGQERIDMQGIAVAIDPAPRPPVDLQVTSLLSTRTKRGLVELTLVEGDEQHSVQLDVAKAREVSAMFGQGIEAAISDEVTFAFLQEIGLSAEQATSALLRFRELRQGSRDVVRPS